MLGIEYFEHFDLRLCVYGEDFMCTFLFESAEHADCNDFYNVRFLRL